MNFLRQPFIIATLFLGSISFLAASSAQLLPRRPPLFSTLDNFVLFASEELNIENGTQISSGDLGANKTIDIEKDVIVSGNLFANIISIDKNTFINGNASFNKLKIHKDAQILGSTTSPVSLPIANLPVLPNEFPIGTQNLTFTGTSPENTLPSGNYRDIIVEKDSRLVLTGGIYNVRKLELKDRAILVFNAPTTLNIQFKLRGHNKTAILPGANQLLPQDLRINYIGIQSKREKDPQEDDDSEIEQLLDAKERKDHKKRKIGRPIVFGKESVLNFKLLAPKANVHIEKETILRGQVWSRKIIFEKLSTISRGLIFTKIADPTKIIVEEDGSQFPVNEIIVNFAPEATLSDAMQVAELINGQIIGFIASANAYLLEVPVATIENLQLIIQKIGNIQNPLIQGVFPNFVLNLL